MGISGRSNILGELTPSAEINPCQSLSHSDVPSVLLTVPNSEIFASSRDAAAFGLSRSRLPIFAASCSKMLCFPEAAGKIVWRRYERLFLRFDPAHEKHQQLKGLRRNDPSANKRQNTFEIHPAHFCLPTHKPGQYRSSAGGAFVNELIGLKHNHKIRKIDEVHDELMLGCDLRGNCIAGIHKCERLSDSAPVVDLRQSQSSYRSTAVPETHLRIFWIIGFYSSPVGQYPEP